MSKRPPFARRRCHFSSPCKETPRSQTESTPLLLRLGYVPSCRVGMRTLSQTASFSTLGLGMDPSLFLLAAGSRELASSPPFYMHYIRCHFKIKHYVKSDSLSLLTLYLVTHITLTLVLWHVVHSAILQILAISNQRINIFKCHTAMEVITLLQVLLFLPNHLTRLHWLTTSTICSCRNLT